MVNKEKNFVSAVIYVYNAENRIRIFLNAIIRIMENNFEHSEIICVNDSSDDHSADIIKEVSAIASSTSVFIVNTSYFHGLEISFLNLIILIWILHPVSLWTSTTIL